VRAVRAEEESKDNTQDWALGTQRSRPGLRDPFILHKLTSADKLHAEIAAFLHIKNPRKMCREKMTNTKEMTVGWEHSFLWHF
jgi:hypothetical protein